MVHLIPSLLLDRKLENCSTGPGTWMGLGPHFLFYMGKLPKFNIENA
jgi:hypothetical protein